MVTTTHVIRMNMNKIAKNKNEWRALRGRKEVSSYLRSCNRMVYIIVPFICICGWDMILTFRRLVLVVNVLSPIRWECLQIWYLRHSFGCRNSIRREVKLPNIDATRHCGWFMFTEYAVWPTSFVICSSQPRLFFYQPHPSSSFE